MAQYAQDAVAPYSFIQNTEEKLIINVLKSGEDNKNVSNLLKFTF